MTDRKKFLWPLCMIAFVVLGLYILLGWLTPFLLETAALTPFYTTSWFFRDVVSEPCGLMFYVELLCIAVAGCLVADRSTCASCRDVTQGVPHIAGMVALVPPAIVAVVAGLYRVGLPVLAHQDSSLSLYHATWHVVFSVLSMPLA